MQVSNLHIKISPKAIFTLFLVINAFVQTICAQTMEVMAQQGDGIYKLLERHGMSGTRHLDAFVAINRGRFGENYALSPGKTYLIPDTTGSRPDIPVVLAVNQKHEPVKKDLDIQQKPVVLTKRFEILGNQYQDVEITGNQLNGAIYYLVPGHGGPDPGAIAKYNGNMLCEDEYAYDVALRLARNLIQNGATVYMIVRDTNDGIRDEGILKPDNDETCYPDKEIPLNQLARLKQRTNAVNQLYRVNKPAFQRVIAIHVDSRSQNKNIDIFFYHDSSSKTGKKAAEILKQTIEDKYNYNQPGRGYKGTVSNRKLYEVANTIPVAIYIELGNINHSRDLQRLIVTNNRQAIANWLSQGLITDFRTNK
jgi:N-acetylmuramoyl-L-alanine amidase